MKRYSSQPLPRFSPEDKCLPATFIRLLADLLSESGVSVIDLLHDTGIDLADISDAAINISITQYNKAYDNAARLFDKPGLGLLLGQRLQTHHRRVLAYAVRSCDKVEDALKLFCRYSNLIYLNQLLEIDNEVVHLYLQDFLTDGPSVRRTFVEEALSTNYHQFKEMVEGPFRPQELALDYPEQGDRKLYESFFDCPVHFDQPYIRMSFGSEVLQLPMKFRDASARETLEKKCRELQDKLAYADSFIGRVEFAIKNNLGKRHDLDYIAEQLHYSPRTLRRRLQLEGISFRELLSRVRKELALQYLSNGESRSIEEISFLLGYSQATNFRQAFKKWTGTVPSDFR